MKRVILTLFICVAFWGETIGQDPNFSQFFASPLTLNPALTGKFDGLYRIAGNYRNQWPTFNNAFTTASFSASAIGAPPLAYSWRKNGASLQDTGNVSGATSHASRGHA